MHLGMLFTCVCDGVGPRGCSVHCCCCAPPSVFLVESLGTTHDAMKHLKALVFVRPTRRNIELLQAELKAPRYSEYNICARPPVLALPVTASTCHGCVSVCHSQCSLLEHVGDGAGIRAAGRACTCG